MRLNGRGPLSFEDARTWIEETGLCLFLPKRQPSTFIAPSFVEAVAGRQNPAPDPKQIALAEQLLVRLETEGVAVRLNLLACPASSRTSWWPPGCCPTSMLCAATATGAAARS